MSARYVYFRTPEGKPDRSTDAGNAPRNLLGLLGRNSRLNDKGQIEYPGSEMIRFNVALESAVVVLGPDGVELNEHDTHQVLWRGLKAVGRKAPGSPINPVELLREADRAAAEFYRLPPVGYTLVASLSVARFPAKGIGIGGCSVAPIRGRAEYGVPDALDSPAREALAAHLRSTGYQFVRVATEGRSVFEAVDRGTNALSLLRGLWSLFATFGTWTIFSQPQRRPLGVIHAGPLYTLHHPDKRAAIENRYWFEPDYIADRPLFSPKADNWQKIEKNRRWATRRLARLGYRADLERLLVRYADALDQPNQDLAFLQMWSILEKLTDRVGAKYDETIRRAVSQLRSPDRPVFKDVLEALRFRRNQYVHSGRSAQEGDQIAYLMKSFVDPHLLHLLINPFGCESLEDYGRYLALPTDVAVLEERQRFLARAIRALRRREHRPS